MHLLSPLRLSEEELKSLKFPKARVASSGNYSGDGYCSSVPKMNIDNPTGHAQEVSCRLAAGYLKLPENIRYFSLLLTMVGDEQAARYKKLRCSEALRKGCRTLYSQMYETHMNLGNLALSRGSHVDPVPYMRQVYDEIGQFVVAGRRTARRQIERDTKGMQLTPEQVDVAMQAEEAQVEHPWRPYITQADRKAHAARH